MCRTLFDKLVGARYFNRWVVFFIDLVLSFIATVAAWLILNYVFSLGAFKTEFLTLSITAVMATAISSYIFKSYTGIIRHSPFTEVGRIMCMSLLKAAIIVVTMFQISEMPAKEIIIGATFDFFLTLFMLSACRVVMIQTYYFLVDRVGIPKKDKLLIIDNGEGNAPVSDSFRKEYLSNYQVEGYLRAGRSNHLRIGQYKVYSIENEGDFRKLVHRLHIRALFFTGHKTVKNESDRIVKYAANEKLKMLFLPSIDEVLQGKQKLRNLPELRIEDLLGRDEIKINMEEIAESLKGKSVLVTGAAGSIGSEICRQLCTFGLKDLILFDSAETPMHNIRLELEEKFPDVHFEPVMGDIRMENRVESVFRRFHPQMVFHAAAYKHVPLMEENPCEAVHTNVYGTRIVANTAVKYGVEKFVMISTDKAVNPANVMGASKRLAEVYVQSFGVAINNGSIEGRTQFITTRFGNVLGSNGSVIPRFKEQLAKGGPLTVTHPEITRYFMTIPEACRLVLEATFMGKGGEIFVFDMGTPVKIVDLARRMIEFSGLEPGKDIEIKFTGLRPGEKLYEELLATKENTIPTENKKIMRAKVREYDYNVVDNAIDELTDLAIKVEKVEMVKKMKQILPEYKSMNSEYEKLDK